MVEVAGFDNRRRVNGRWRVGPQDDSIFSGVRQRRLEFVSVIGGIRIRRCGPLLGEKGHLVAEVYAGCETVDLMDNLNDNEKDQHNVGTAI